MHGRQPAPVYDLAAMHPEACPPPVDSPYIHCKFCDRQYPIAMWATRGGAVGLERRCPNLRCQTWQLATAL